MPKRKNYDNAAVARLFAVQGGLAGRSQLMALGVPASTIRHRTRADGPWSRVLRGVCADRGQWLRSATELGRLWAALLFAGSDAVITGIAALRLHGVHCVSHARYGVGPTAPPSTAPPPTPTSTAPTPTASASAPVTPAPSPSAPLTPTAPTSTLPAPISSTSLAPAPVAPAPATAPAPTSAPTSPFPTVPTIKVLIPATRRHSSAGFVLVSRTRRLPEPVVIDGFRVAPVVRAAVDACLDTRDTELMRAIITELLRSGRCTVQELRAELEAAQRHRSARMRAVLIDFTEGISARAQAQCLRSLVRVAAPPPLWNRRIIEQSTGRVARLPGAFWLDRGVALEVGSEHDPAAQERAAARRRWLARVLHVTVAQVTPHQVRDCWEDVWGELRGLLDRPATYRLPPGYVLG